MENQTDNWTDSSQWLLRITGYATMLLGGFALYHCFPLVDQLWNSPKRSLTIIVTSASIFIILLGTAIGFPELLPKWLVRLVMCIFGLLSTLMGILILGWFGYNVIVDEQKQFEFGDPSIAITMITFGCGLALRFYFVHDDESEDYEAEDFEPNPTDREHA